MTPHRLQAITEKYPALRVAVVGDFCLDRYLEIDPARQEISIETGLAVHNVVNVRSQPGGAGTILNNLSALGLAQIFPVGFCGEDGEGFELFRALQARTGVNTENFFQTNQRRTFTYTKPLVMEQGRPPAELNRLDFKNWSATPDALVDRVIASLRRLAAEVDALILLDQVDVAETGVVTSRVLETIRGLAGDRPDILILADSRRGLAGYPPVVLKMNRAELAALAGQERVRELGGVQQMAATLARTNRRAVFVTLSEEGILGAGSDGAIEHVPALPVRGPIDIVGAGDAVTANLASALAAGASVREASELAMLASSSVIHQLGTTGTASVAQLTELASRRG